jgi:hypothetical protein
MWEGYLRADKPSASNSMKTGSGARTCQDARGMWVLSPRSARSPSWCSACRVGAVQRHRRLAARLVVSDLQIAVAVEFDGTGQSADLSPGREHTFVVRREQFPATFRVINPEGAGSVVFEHRFTYEELVDAEFRISIDAEGFHRTTDLRDEDIGRPTPVSTPA